MNTTPQGWYRDPADQTRVRWFDGQAWTANCQAAPRPGSGPLPPPAPAAAAAPTRAAVDTLPARAASVPTPRSPVAIVVPALVPDDPVAEPVAETEPPASVAPQHETPAEQPAAPAPAPYAPNHDPGYAAAASAPGVAPFSPVVPQQFTPEPVAPETPAQYRSEFAPDPTAQPELPPYVARPQTPAPYAAAPGAFGQPPAAYPQPPIGAMPGFAPHGTGWQGGGQPWAAQPAKKNPAKVVLIVLASVLGGLVLLGILASVAIPVFLNERAKSQVAAMGLDTVTCEQVAFDAVRISAAGQSPDTAPLVAMTDVSLVQDNRSTLRIPHAVNGPALVMSCAGTGSRPDGTTAPVTADLYIDSTTQRLVAYTWAQ